MTREDAIGVLEDIRDAICENIPGSHPELDELKEAVQMAVNALEERKTGKWLWFDGVRCSNCNYKLQTTGLTSYCPNCGARMSE